jgi:hypothetical protein
MPAVFNAQLSEVGGKYNIVNIIMSEAKYILPNAKYVALPNEVALRLKNELNQGKLIYIRKEFVDNPVSKDIPFEHFNIELPKELNQKKSAAKARVHQKISAYTSMLTAFDALEFWLISSKLTAMGFNVMDESNKEQTYLNIIQTGNDDLITDLERFLEVKDIFDNMMRKYRELKRYFKEIDECDDEKELEEVIDYNKGWLAN